MLFRSDSYVRRTGDAQAALDAVKVGICDQEWLDRLWSSDQRVWTKAGAWFQGKDKPRAYWARTGHLDAVQWSDGEFVAKDCTAAAAGGHWHILVWLRKQQCPWDAKTCAAAARHGHFLIVRWLHANGCPWDSATCSGVARHGDLNTIH